MIRKNLVNLTGGVYTIKSKRPFKVDVVEAVERAHDLDPEWSYKLLGSFKEETDMTENDYILILEYLRSLKESEVTRYFAPQNAKYVEWWDLF